MKNRLIEYCRSLNIEYVGIAPPGPYLDFEEIWAKQIEKGHVSGLEEKDIKRRVYPELTLEGTKSVIVCLFPYFTGNVEGANLSKYSYSLDYHIIIKNKLDAIGKFLEANVQDFKYKSFVDNGPLSDRYLAWKAGLGFWGINNHIITDKHGSYVFIGYILNNYPFEPDKPQDRTCRKCLDCVRKCPGQCILGDFTINPQRCKSYITQKKGELTERDIEIMSRNGLIWGCDVCQDVCPHNKNIKTTEIEEFRKNLVHKLCYNELRQISNKEFRRRYGDRCFSWRGKGVLQRNYEIINKIK
ncbi:MAG TPA: tRNA epoxyqueuosine(34) reductase QueG [Clostridiaceae bacterium]|nr:tRNA epoxyqueuosine(34) reductase QueG [Clostridiaceae bacterium]